MSQFDQIDIRRLDMTLLLVFAELMRQRKLRTVGERLGLTQSAVSHALKRLRDIFGHELFVRRPHGVEPTARAVELEPAVDRILALARDVLMTKEEFDPAKVRRALRIGMLDYGAILLGPKFLTSTRVIAPDLRVAIWFFGRMEAFSALASGEIDVAFGVFPRTPADYVREELFRDDCVVVARVRHPRIRSRITLAQYLREDHVVVSQSGELRGFVDRDLAAIGASRRNILALPSFVAALAIVGETDFLGTLPRRLAERFAGKLKLQCLDVPFATRPFTISAIRHRREAQNPLITWAIERLRVT
jgi:DNA-binding transcriptional LysR family regulator